MNSGRNKRLNKKEAINLIAHYDAAFFDLDGTLVNTNKINYNLYKNIFKTFNIAIAKQEWEYFFNGSKLDTALRIYLKSIGKYKLFKSIHAYFENNGDKMKVDLLKKKKIKFINLGYILLRKAIKLNKKIILCTSARRIFVDLILRQLDMENCFDYMICGEDVKNGKPNPEIYNKAKKFVTKRNVLVLVIEDSSNGLIAAQKAKCHCLLLAEKFYRFYR